MSLPILNCNRIEHTKKPYLPPRVGFFVCFVYKAHVTARPLVYLTHMNGKIIFGFFVAVLACASQAEAALLYMDPNTSVLSRGDTLKVSVRLDTDESECINVIDGVISYSENILPVDISRGSSIASIWVEEPVIDKENHTITFAGGIPNGYCGRIAGDPRLTNVVLDLLFQSPGFVIGANSTTTDASIFFTDQTQVLRNDGFGTQAPLRTTGAKISLLKKAGGTLVNQWKEITDADVLPPEGFSISLERIPNQYGKYSIIFNTSDKQSGIDHYEVIEESLREARLFKWGREDAPWKTVRSPYELTDQTLNSTIRVRAIDKAGNEYIAILLPDESKRTISLENKILLILTGGLIISILFIGLFMFLRSLRKKKKTINEDISNFETKL